MNEASINDLCNAVMRGMVVAARELVAANLDKAVELGRAEIKAFLLDDEYADARDCVLRRSIHDGYVVGLVVANVIAKLRRVNG